MSLYVSRSIERASTKASLTPLKVPLQRRNTVAEACGHICRRTAFLSPDVKHYCPE
jgi:hypothetical protein